MPLASYYHEQISTHSFQLQKLQRKILLIALFRLLVFIAAAIVLYGFFRYGGDVNLLAGILLLLGFVLLVKWNFRLNDRKTLLQKLIFINTNEVEILNGRRNSFHNGSQFLSDDSFGHDIDIFGDQSLFHILNRTTTSHGTNQLANSLQKPMTGKPDIQSVQHAVKLLSEQTALRQLITAYGLLHGEKEGNLHEIRSWLDTPDQLHKSRWVKIILWLLPAFSITALLYYLSSDRYGLMALAVIACWSCIAIFLRYITAQQLLLGKKQAILDQYAAILETFSKVQAGSSVFLQKLQNDASKAFQSIQKLSRLSSMLDQRLNLLVNVFLNSFIVYDLQCLYALEKWKRKNKTFFDTWIDCVGNIESLNSLATYAFNNPDFCIAVVEEEGLTISATAMSHPLIPKTERVANDFELGKPHKLALVTGSNMSGKTTFLRTLGINLLLAQCGAPVCASSFSLTPMHLLTAIRISDSLQLHTSYFMAELKRLQQIIQFLHTGKPGLVLVDEILRGTNSDDKSHGSEEFIRKLITFNCLALFATHDLTLSSLENNFQDVITNYCFESTISSEELFFDYKLRRGVAKNKNASFLMKKMEII